MKVSDALESRGRLELVWGSTLYHKDDLPLSENLIGMPDVFTPFRNIVERKCKPRKVE